MQNFIYDMGYDEFAKLDELRYTLPYAIASGLAKAGENPLLCDFSDAGKAYSGYDMLCAALALSEEMAGLSGKPRIGVLIPPSFEAAAANYALTFAGKIPVNLNFTMGPVAAKSCVETADIDVMLTCRKFREKISAANPKYPWTSKVEYLEDILENIPIEKLTMLHSRAEKDFGGLLASYNIDKYADNSKEATLVFTSGSEGAPKAAILTQKNIIANCLQVKASRVFTDDDVLLANLPVFHSFGLLFEVWLMAIEPRYTVSLFNPLDIKSNIRAIKEKRATVMIGSPTFFRAYIKYANPEDLKTLKKAIAGAEKTPAGFEDLWNSTFSPNSYREGYGLTETTPVVGVNMQEADYGYFSTGSRKGSIGKLFPGMKARILDVSTRKELPFGQRGLLSMLGPNVFAGYLGRPEATAEVFDGDWLVTGDLARIDSDGFLYIDGRLSRFSKIGGEMVPHATVEDALNKAFGFDSAQIPMLAVSSRLDEGKGEALVVVTADKSLTLHKVKDALRAAGISNLWQPKYIVATDKIPLLASGKLDLFKLAELAKDGV